MRLDRDAGCRCQLLFAVHPTFVDALPTVCPTSSIEDVNSITLLRDAVKMIPITFNHRYAEYSLSERAYQDGLEALNDILCLFETLVNGDLQDLLGLTCHENLEEKKLFPKLEALKHRISKTESILNHPVQSASCPVSFGTSRAQYRVANIMAHSFCQTMSRIFSQVDRQSSVRVSQAHQDVEMDMSTLYQAQKLSEASKHLSRLLKTKICRRASRTHEARMRLSGFDSPEFDMTLSLCEGPNLWQQVYFSERSLTSSDGQGGIREICAELKRSYRSKKLSKMFFDGKDICKDPSTQNWARTSIKASRMTIRQILQKEEGIRRSRGLHHREIKKNEKQRLGMLIASSLLHLYGGPFLHDVLNADTIYIVQDTFEDANKGAFREAYITCSLSSEQSEVPSLVEDPVPGDPYILALTMVLLELELEEQVIVQTDDIDEFSELPSLYMALTRLHEDSNGNIDVQFSNIIDSCLQLYDQFSEIESKEYNRKVRTELFKKVVYPLKKRYEVLSSPGDLLRSKAFITQEPASDVALFPSHPQPLPPQAPAIKIMSESSEMEAMIESSAAPSNPLALISEPLHFASLGTISSSNHWLDRIDWINKNLDSLRRRYPTAQRVKIAILDTGCDLDAPCLISLGSTDARLLGHWCDWSGSSRTPIDEDTSKHGTTLVALLLRVAVHTDVFVSRVAKNERELGFATEQISKAIRHAAIVWDVDIITMSFGFPRIESSIRDAIHDAIMEKRNRNKEILFFAAANNDGSNSKELFPASHESVISVRGTDHTGSFVNKYNPEAWPQKKEPLYGTLGDSVPFDIGDPARKTSGCSIATPILAGITAMIIQYVYYAANGDTRTYARLKTRAGVLRVLYYIAIPKSEDRRYVAPWEFFERNEEDRLVLIKHALAELQPQV